MPITTCLFDMGNVLLHFSHEKMCRNIAAVCEAPTQQISDLLMGSGLQAQLESGTITEQQFHACFEQQLGKNLDFAELKHAAADIFWLNESIVPLIEQLKEQGIRLVLLSNTSITHLEYIQRHFDILEHFDALTTSFEAGAMKPDRGIYEDALSKANCPPEHCFYTDDIEDYVLKARTLGIHAAVYTDTAETRRELRLLGVRIPAQ